jgi:hypothetical protein
LWRPVAAPANITNNMVSTKLLEYLNADGYDAIEQPFPVKTVTFVNEIFFKCTKMKAHYDYLLTGQYYSAITSLHDFIATVVAINDDLTLRVLLEIANLVGCSSDIIEKIAEIIECEEMIVS